MANGSYQRPVGGFNLTSVSQSTVSRAISEVCQLITRHLMPIYVKFPTSLQEKTTIKEGCAYRKQAMVQRNNILCIGFLENGICEE